MEGSIGGIFKGILKNNVNKKMCEFIKFMKVALWTSRQAVIELQNGVTLLSKDFEVSVTP